MSEPLPFLIAQAAALAGGDLCTAEHAWEAEGGRPCPRRPDNAACSQTVYRCRRCGEYDYGERGGPAYEDCYGEERGCDWACDEVAYG